MSSNFATVQSAYSLPPQKKKRSKKLLIGLPIVVLVVVVAAVVGGVVGSRKSTSSTTADTGAAAPVTTTNSVGSTVVTTPTATPTTAPASAPTFTSTISGSVTVKQIPLQTNAAIPSSASTKYVYAHHMVGITQNYTPDLWASDIALAASTGIDGFALNFGADSYSTTQLNAAYAAAQAFGSGFKMFLNGTTLRNYVTSYAAHPNQAMYGGKVLVSTFAGEKCNFGESSVSAGWTNQFRTPLTAAGVNINFIPALFDTTLYAASFHDGIFNWNGAWPTGSTNLDPSADTQFIASSFSGTTKSYIAGISPNFFTYYGTTGQYAYDKDWIYRGDDNLMAARWEGLIANRGSLDLVEIITWNDYGESHYIGPIRADQPGSSNWVNGFPHDGLRGLVSFYASAFKTGTWPTFTDQIYLYSRPHSKLTTATSPSLAKPTRWEATDDALYAVVILANDATVLLTAGTNSYTFNLTKGLTKLSISSSPGTISAQINRNGTTALQYNAGGNFSWVQTPTDYNFNIFVGSAP